MRRKEKLVDWALIEQLKLKFGGVADDPVAAANIERLKAGKGPNRALNDQRRPPANINKRAQTS